jgi:hypothetical protein
MHVPIPDFDVGLMLALLWVGVIWVVFAGFVVRSWWRSKHPLPPSEPPTSYSRRLPARFGSHKSGKPPHE